MSSEPKQPAFGLDADEPAPADGAQAPPATADASSEPAAPAAAAADTSQDAEAGAVSQEKLEEMVVDALRTVYDPEIPVNIYDLGLIYDIRVTGVGEVAVKMTLTTPHCPVAGSMPGMVEQAVRHVHAVKECDIELVWDPPWNPDMMTEAARLQLNI